MIWLKSPTAKGSEFSWLTEQGSLTERLQKELNDVKVDVIYEGVSLENRTDYVREVLIKSHNEPKILTFLDFHFYIESVSQEIFYTHI